MFRLELDERGLARRIQGLEARGADLRLPLNQFFIHMRGVTVQHFNALAQGGTNRGVSWAYFAPQYTRKEDGVEVPAWGGVPNIGQFGWIQQRVREKALERGEAVKRPTKRKLVKGRLRPSGKRIKNGDAILQDTRRLLRSVTSQPDIKILTDVSLTWGTRLPYASKQHERRPFLFFTAEDTKELERLVARHLTGGR